MSKRCFVRVAHPDDAAYLAPRLRPEDKAEVRASSGRTPLEALTISFDLSDPVYTICYSNADPVGMFGVVPTDEPGVGAVWMLATPRIESMQFPFLRQCRKWIDHLNDLYPLLYNFVDGRNLVHMKWLRWMNFIFLECHPRYGVEALTFYEFARMKHNV